MKKLLVLLFSLFFFSSPSVFADDMSDFSIEGISIGDSLLDYMTEEQILKEIEINKNDYYYLNEPNKYAEVYLFQNLQQYDSASFFVTNSPTSKYITDKNRNEKYRIVTIRGLIDYTKGFDGCLQKRDEIVEELSQLFPNTQKTEAVFPHGADPSGNSMYDVVYFDFGSGAQSEVSCADLEESFRIKMGWVNNLSVAIKSKEIVSWLSDY